MLNTNYPKYIERGGEQAIRQPYEFKNAVVHNFLVTADQERLQSLCDRFLNQRTSGNIIYKVAMPYILLAFVDNEKVYSLDPKYRKSGWMSEIDVAFWIPVISYQILNGILIPRSLAWFMPYLFVDSASAMIAGREIYGFHKIMGEFILPKLNSSPDIFAVETVGVDCFAPDNQWTKRRLFEVHRTDSNLNNPHQIAWTSIDTASRYVEQLFASKHSDLLGKAYEVASNFINLSSLKTITIVFLKQFRDVEKPTHACYQAVVEAQAKVHNFRAGGLLQGTYELNIYHLDSHPIAKDLGLKVGNQLITEAFWFHYDFTMETGKEISHFQ